MTCSSSPVVKAGIISRCLSRPLLLSFSPEDMGYVVKQTIVGVLASLSDTDVS